eukprot:3480881-Prymnesium_polylepis.1
MAGVRDARTARVGCAAAGCACFRATCESEARAEWAREAARRRGGACVHVRAVLARRWLTCCLRRDAVHAIGDARWARRPPHATAFRGEGDGEGGVEGGGKGGDGDGDVGRRSGIRLRGTVVATTGIEKRRRGKRPGRTRADGA